MKSTTELSAAASEVVAGARHVQGCWSIFTRAISYPGVMNACLLSDLVEALHRGEDWGSGELDFELIAGELRVSFLDDASTCPPDQMMALLVELRSRYLAEQSRG